jgi:uncharacterized membrane protein
MRERRTWVIVFITFLVIFEAAAYVATTPRPTEQFFQVYVLGSNHLAADYYPNDDPNIRLGDSVRWYVGVTNFMGSVQLVDVRVKLGNETISPPDDQSGLPSPAPLVAESLRFLQDNETWEFPFVWQILNVTESQGATRILLLQINNQTYPVQSVDAVNGYNFRFIIELWTWNVDSNGFGFGWYAGSEHRVAWLQVWFNATSTGVV